MTVLEEYEKTKEYKRVKQKTYSELRAENKRLHKELLDKNEVYERNIKALRMKKL